MGKQKRRNCHGRSYAQHPPGPGGGQKGNLCPGLEARHGRPHRCLPHHLGGDGGRPGPDHNRAAADPGHRGGGPDRGEAGASGPPCSPGRPAAPQRLSPGRCPGGFGSPVSGLRAAAPGADPPGAGRLPGVPDPLPPGRGRPRPGAGGAGWREEAPGQAALGGLFSHLRGALLAGGGEVPAGDLVLRDSPPAVCPGAGCHGRLSHRHGDHHRPLPPAVVLGARQGGLGPGL